jgi:hypothetical protein
MSVTPKTVQGEEERKATLSSLQFNVPVFLASNSSNAIKISCFSSSLMLVRAFLKALDRLAATCGVIALVSFSICAATIVPGWYGTNFDPKGDNPTTACPACEDPRPLPLASGDHGPSFEVGHLRLALIWDFNLCLA